MSSSVSPLRFRSAALAVAIFVCGLGQSAFATTPSGGWTLATPSPDSKDYFLRIDVDPGETYSVAGYAPSSTYFAQYINFKNQPGGTGGSGYLGLQRASGKKLAIVSIWSGLAAEGNALPVSNCYEFGPCVSIKGEYDWKVGHQYRFRVERSPKRGGQWWQITLADLTTGTEDILGELQTPDWGSLSDQNGLFLENFHGPYQCDTLRHSKATFAPVRGDYGQATTLSKFSGYTYGDPFKCDPAQLPSGMALSDYLSSSVADSSATVTTVGNNYRGLQQYGKFNSNAKAGMMFTSDPAADYPDVFMALKDGTYGPFPTDGNANAYWQPLGKAYPIINDLYFTKRPLRLWSERGASYVSVGDYFIYQNPYNHDIEYFKLLKSGAGYFPTDKTSNAYWQYVGRHSRSGESVHELAIHEWSENNQIGRVGSVYQSGNMFFRLKTAAKYGYFPTSAADNNDWAFLGYHR
jgi:hypothetical protein